MSQFGGMAEGVLCAIRHTIRTGRRPRQPDPGHPLTEKVSQCGGMAEWLKAPVLKIEIQPNLSHFFVGEADMCVDADSSKSTGWL